MDVLACLRTALQTEEGTDMARFLAAFAVASTLAAAPALADYKTCMTHCMTEYDFDHCHAICTTVRANPPAPATSSPDRIKSDQSTAKTAGPASARVCQTLDEKMDAIDASVAEQYGSPGLVGLSIFANNDGSFDIFFYPLNKACEGAITVDNECRIEGSIECEPDNRD